MAEKKQKRDKRRVIVGNSDWDQAEIRISESYYRRRSDIIVWVLALGALLALIVAGFALVHDDKLLVGQVLELARHLLLFSVGWAVGARKRRQRNQSG